MQHRRWSGTQTAALEKTTTRKHMTDPDQWESSTEDGQEGLTKITHTQRKYWPIRRQTQHTQVLANKKATWKLTGT